MQVSALAAIVRDVTIRREEVKRVNEVRGTNVTVQILRPRPMLVFQFSGIVNESGAITRYGPRRVSAKPFILLMALRVLADEKVEILYVSPWNIENIIGFDHDVTTQISNVEDSFQVQTPADGFAVNVL